MKKALPLLALLCAPLVCAANSTDCHLRVGWEEWYPLIYQQNEQLVGSEYSELQALAHDAGCTLAFIEEPWARALQKLKQGRLDLLYGASHSLEREAFARFSQPYRVEEMVLVIAGVRSSAPAANLSLRQWLNEPRADGRPRTLGVIRGFYYGEELEPIVRDPQATAQRLEVRWDQQLLDVLARGRIDGYLVEDSVARAMQRESTQPLQSFGVSEHTEEPMHLMFSRAVPESVVQRFNAAIARRPR